MGFRDCSFVFINACAHAFTHTIINKMDQFPWLSFSFCPSMDSWLSFLTISKWVNYWKNANKSQENSERIIFPAIALWKRVLHTDQNTSHVCTPISYIRCWSAFLYTLRHANSRPSPTCAHHCWNQCKTYFVTDIGGIEGQKLSEDGKWCTFIFMNTRTHPSECRNKWNIRFSPQHPFHTVIDGNEISLNSPVICLLSFSHPLTQSLQQTRASWIRGRTRRNAQSSENLIYVAANIMQVRWMHECTHKWKYKWVMECTHDCSKWMNERMDEGTNT